MTENINTIDDQKRSQLDTAFFGHPRPLKSLFFTEFWERFSFYGIRPLLIFYMAALVAEGGLGFDRATASAIVGIFGGCMYIAALPGGWLADHWLGQAKAVWYGSLLIACGHLCIALSAILGSTAFFIGLLFIILGSGLFKTCISVLVGTLYKEKDPRRDGGFSIFYMGINMGSFCAPFITGLLKENMGWHWGFGIGGVGMLIALIIFKFSALPNMEKFEKVNNITGNWRNPIALRKGVASWVTFSMIIIAVLVFLIASGFIPVNPITIAKSMTYIIGGSVFLYFFYLFFFCHLNALDKSKLIVCLILFCAAAFFWAAFEQKPTSFNLFAQDYTNRQLFNWTMPATFFQSFNPLFIVLFAPLFSILWIKLAKNKIEPSSFIKFALGLICAGIGFSIMMFAAKNVLAGNGATVSPFWLISSILLLTLGELFLSPVGLSIMSSLAPQVIRGQVMGLWFAASSIGNLVAGLIGGHVSADQIGNLPTLFWRCAVALFIGAIVLLLLNKPVKSLLKRGQEIDDKNGVNS